VAATRAKEMLIVSGVAGARGALPDGTVEGSWYHRLQTVQERAIDDTAQPPAGSAAGAESEFTLPIFAPPVLAPATMNNGVKFHNAAIDEGIALHSVLERVTQSHRWPVSVPEAELLARWLPCPYSLAVVIREQALTILSQPELERFFNPSYYRHARNEMEVMVNGELLRFDRAVVFEEEVWILDYKRDVLESERADYRAQLARYREAAQAVFHGKRLMGALITPDGRLWLMD
jgi:ATP-dependent helicase/nuclease subunit A